MRTPLVMCLQLIVADQQLRPCLLSLPLGATGRSSNADNQSFRQVWRKHDDRTRRVKGCRFRVVWRHECVARQTVGQSIFKFSTWSHYCAQTGTNKIGFVTSPTWAFAVSHVRRWPISIINPGLTIWFSRSSTTARTVQTYPWSAHLDGSVSKKLDNVLLIFLSFLLMILSHSFRLYSPDIAPNKHTVCLPRWRHSTAQPGFHQASSQARHAKCRSRHSASVFLFHHRKQPDDTLFLTVCLTFGMPLRMCHWQPLWIMVLNI